MNSPKLKITDDNVDNDEGVNEDDLALWPDKISSFCLMRSCEMNKTFKLNFVRFHQVTAWNHTHYSGVVAQENQINTHPPHIWGFRLAYRDIQTHSSFHLHETFYKTALVN